MALREHTERSFVEWSQLRHVIPAVKLPKTAYMSLIELLGHGSAVGLMTGRRPSPTLPVSSGASEGLCDARLMVLVECIALPTTDVVQMAQTTLLVTLESSTTLR